MKDISFIDVLVVVVVVIVVEHLEKDVLHRAALGSCFLGNRAAGDIFLHSAFVEGLLNHSFLFACRDIQLL